MNFLQFIYYEAAFYWPWWLCFIAIAFVLARYLGWFGLVVSIPIVSALIFVIEVHSVFQDMKQFPNSGRDADGVFFFGVLCRIVFYNACLLPVSIFGVTLRRRRKRIT
jgi:hypothetical protein